jgi:hypothetical protein
MIKARLPTVEMHIDGNGGHANGPTDRDGRPFGKRPDRFIDCGRDPGFVGMPGIETRRGATPRPTSRRRQHRSNRRLPR